MNSQVNNASIMDAETRNQPGSSTRKRPKSKSNLSIIRNVKKEIKS